VNSIKIVAMTIIAIMLHGCAPDKSGQPFSFPSNAIAPAPVPVPVPTSGGGGTGPTPAPGTGGGSCTSTQAATTTGGCISASSQFTTTIATNQTFSGLASDSSSLYMLLYQNDGGGIHHWIIQKNLLAGAGWSNIGYDGTYFYITDYQSSSTNIRRFLASNCSTASTVSVGYVVNMLDTTKYIASDGASSLYFGSVQISGNAGNFASFNSSTGTLINSSGEVSLGGQTTNWGMPSGLSFGGGYLWAILPNSGGTNPLLWKLTSAGAAVGWSNLAATGNSNLTQLSAVTVQSTSTAIVMTNFTTATQLQFTILNISGF